MGMLSLNHLMLKQKLRRRQRTQARNGSTITLVPQKDLLCQEGGERSTYLTPNLPEDIWCHIHSLMPLQDAAQSASISHTFLSSWRCHPYLNFTEETLRLKQNARQGYRARRFIMTVDQILKNHSGIGVKTLKLSLPYYCEVDACHLNRWLQIAITPGIEEVTLLLPPNYKKKYSFPCSLLFGGCGNSIQYIFLAECAFRPPVGFDCLRSLRNLRLFKVHITCDELGSLISNCFALEKLELQYCDELIFLKIPLWLERLRCLIATSYEL